MNLLDRYAQIHTTQEHEMKVIVCELLMGLHTTLFKDYIGTYLS